MDSFLGQDKLIGIGGIYRGVVIDNTGAKGKCKIFVPTIYPDAFQNDPISLPWAEPAMPISGGYTTLPSYRRGKEDGSRTMYVNENGSIRKKTVKIEKSIYNFETGKNIVPKNGAHVWVFFDGNNQNYPVYIAIVQGGNGWFAENEYQSVFKTDNVIIRIDEHPNLEDKKLVTDPPNYIGNKPLQLVKSICSFCQVFPTFKSSSYFDSFNEHNIETMAPKPTVTEKMPTRIEIEVTGNVQLVIKGNANIQVQGNAFTEICGNHYETVIGDKYEKIKGNYYLEVDKDFKELIKGVHEETVNGNVTETYKATLNTTVTDSVTQTYSSSQNTNVTGNVSITTPKVEVSTLLDVGTTITAGVRIYAPNLGAHTHIVPTGFTGPANTGVPPII